MSSFNHNKKDYNVYKHSISAILSIAMLSACGGADNQIVEQELAPKPQLIAELVDVANGIYSVDKSHAFLSFEVTHANGLSDYRMNFTKFDASIDFQPENPELSTIIVDIDPTSLVTNFPGDYKAGHPKSKFDTWDEDVIRNQRWLNSDQFPRISFISTSIERTGDKTGKVTGDLTLLGVSAPVTLDVTFNGSANFTWLGERDVIGFNAQTIFKRSDFGMGTFVPYIGDEVKVEFTGEFIQDE